MCGGEYACKTIRQSGGKQQVELVTQTGEAIKFTSLVAMMQWLQSDAAIRYLRHRMAFFVSILSINGK